jgi:hypothetical protein
MESTRAGCPHVQESKYRNSWSGLDTQKKRGSAEQVLVYKKVLAFDFSSQLKNPLIHSIMEHIDRNQLYTDSEYRFGYVSKFMDFGK